MKLIKPLKKKRRYFNLHCVVSAILSSQIFFLICPIKTASQQYAKSPISADFVRVQRGGKCARNHIFPPEFTPLTLTLHISTFLKTTTAKGPNCGIFTSIPQTPRRQSARSTVKKSPTWALTPEPSPSFSHLSNILFISYARTKLSFPFIHSVKWKCKKHKTSHNEIHITPPFFFPTEKTRLPFLCRHMAKLFI